MSVTIVDASVRLVALPLREPICTARTTLTAREVLIVRLVADDGTCGFGEVSSFTTDWYLPEILDDDEALMPALFEAVKWREFDSPREIDAVLRAVEGAQALPAARAGVECAIWDILRGLLGFRWRAISALRRIKLQGERFCHSLTPNRRYARCARRPKLATSASK